MLDTRNATLSVRDKRMNQSWQQQDLAGNLILTGAKIENLTIAMTFYSFASGLAIRANPALTGQLPDFSVL